MQTIYLDISNKGVVPIVYAKQGDVGRKFQVVLTDSGFPYVPSSGSAFSVWYSGASGEGNYTDIGDKSAFSVNENKVIVEMISQMLLKDGNGVLSLVLNDGSGNQISTWNIPYICELVPGADSEEAQSYYTAFSQTVEKLQKMEETDPNVPDWAKEPTKPTYTAADVGAAPSGYGLGTGATQSNSPNSVFNGGFYRWDTDNDQTPFSYASMLVLPRFKDNSAVQIAIGHVENNKGVIVVRNVTTTTVGEWEYLNPPMVVGYEYRTTERHNGKTVYCKLCSCGALVSAGNEKRVSLNTEAMTAIVRHSGYVVSGNGACISLPIYGSSNAIGYHIVGNESAAYIVCNGDGSSYTASYIAVWYTKD